jgi:hypothetical protein
MLAAAAVDGVPVVLLPLVVSVAAVAAVALSPRLHY